jgi:hypothetical protein
MWPLGTLSGGVVVKPLLMIRLSMVIYLVRLCALWAPCKCVGVVRGWTSTVLVMHIFAPPLPLVRGFNVQESRACYGWTAGLDTGKQGWALKP